MRLRLGLSTGASSPIAFPEDLDPTAITGGDARVALQTCMDYVGAAGGGQVRLRAPNVYSVQSTSPFGTEGGPNKVCLVPRYNNVEIFIEPGATLRLDMATPATLFLCAGTAKAPAPFQIPTPRDSRNYGGTFNSTSSTWELIKINPAARGATMVQLQNIADAAKVRSGDWLLLRMGGTLFGSEPSTYDTPFGQYARVNVVAGDMVLLDAALKWDINTSVYPVGHNSAGIEVPWGIINMSYPVNAMLEGFKLRGGGNITLSGSDGHSLLTGNFSQYATIGEAKALKITSSGYLFSSGMSRSAASYTILGGGYRAGDTAWAASNDACNHDCSWDVLASGGSLYLHMHEGTTGNVITADLTVSSQWHEMGGFRAYARDNQLTARFMGKDPSTSPPWPQFRTDSSTSGNSGHIDGFGAGVVGRSDVIVDDGSGNSITTNLG